VCIVRGLATGWSSVQGVLPTVYRIKKPKKKSGQGPTNVCRADDDDRIRQDKISRVRRKRKTGFFVDKYIIM
jgi:hypothetical protein